MSISSKKIREVLASEGLTKTSARKQHLDKMHDGLATMKQQFEERAYNFLQRKLDQVERDLLRKDFVMNRNKTHVYHYSDHEGIYPEGTLVFVDKRDHNARGSDEVNAILDDLGFWGYATQDGPGGPWKINFGGK